jgi:putative membrane protein
MGERINGMVVKNLVSAAVTGLLLSAAVGAAPAAAQGTRALVSDSIFIQRVSSDGLLQARLGQLAQKKGSSPSVVEFGKRMVADYSKANEELKTATQQAAFPAPVLLREDQQTFDRFNRMGRSSFDKAYMAEVVRRHSEVVRLFQREAGSGRVQLLKQLASRMLPDMQQRLSLATETAGSVGADVTASSSEARDGSASY